METLGVDPALVIAQIISFIILFVVLRKFLYPQIESALKSRRQAIKDAYQGKEEIEARLKQFEAEKATEHEKLKNDIQKLLSEAKSEASQLKQAGKEAAKVQASNEISLAKKQIDQQKELAKKEIEKHGTDIAKSIVDEILSQKKADIKWQKSQIQSALESLK